NGLLESGKTTLIKEIIENNVSYQAGTTLLVVCEEGETEYEERWLKEYEVQIAYVSKEADLTPEFLMALDEQYQPVQIVLEYNSFYNMDELAFPEYMPVYQQVTLIDASTFGIFFNNMKQIFNNLVKFSSLVIFNRCDGIKDLSLYRRQIRALNQECQIGFERKNGQLTSMLDEDLPYDITKDSIILEDEDYPTWYIDVFDNYEKYRGKTIRFKTFVRDILEDSIVVGRNVMTCCENDIQFLGYEVQNVDLLLGIGDCIFLECMVKREYSKIAEEEVVMLDAKKVSKLPKEEDKVLSL
ncbi:MAG TPA: GTP-binding protein, partial [Candidatus Pelethenecus sp.]|nr:GTP-binding protein [Candidatus Pelethenecus sp.]